MAKKINTLDHLTLKETVAVDEVEDLVNSAIERANELTDGFEKLEESVSDYDARITTNSNNITTNTNSINTINTSIDTINTSIDTINTSIDTINSSITIINNEISSLQSISDSNTDSITELNTNLNNLPPSVKKIDEVNASVVWENISSIINLESSIGYTIDFSKNVFNLELNDENKLFMLRSLFTKYTFIYLSSFHSKGYTIIQSCGNTRASVGYRPLFVIPDTIVSTSSYIDASSTKMMVLYPSLAHNNSDVPTGYIPNYVKSVVEIWNDFGICFIKKS